MSAVVGLIALILLLLAAFVSMPAIMQARLETMGFMLALARSVAEQEVLWPILFVILLAMATYRWMVLAARAPRRP